MEKASLALDLMGIQAGDRPRDTKFLGARRAQSGAVIYTLDSPASANYLRKADVMKSFTEHFGGTAEMRARAHQVVVEHVPVSFDPTTQEALKRAEGASGLPLASIYEARWIKPTHLRSQGQKVAFLIMGFANREAANRALDFGVVIEGKHCRTRKLLPEPKRCAKCQAYGHFARECKSPGDVCARCAGDHRTADTACKAGGEQPLRCANCKKEGHGAADRECEVYQARLKASRARDTDSRYRLFPTDDPKTWGRVGEQAPMDQFDEAWRMDRDDQRPVAPPPRRGMALGQGRGGGRFGAMTGVGAHRGALGRGTGRETENRNPGGSMQPSGGPMRQRTLAETWTNAGGRMGAFGSAATAAASAEYSLTPTLEGWGDEDPPAPSANAPSTQTRTGAGKERQGGGEGQEVPGRGGITTRGVRGGVDRSGHGDGAGAGRKEGQGGLDLHRQPSGNHGTDNGLTGERTTHRGHGARTTPDAGGET